MLSVSHFFFLGFVRVSNICKEICLKSQFGKIFLTAQTIQILEQINGSFMFVNFYSAEKQNSSLNSYGYFFLLPYKQVGRFL